MNYSYFQENVFVKIELVPNDPTFYDSPPQMIPMPDGPILLSNESIPVLNNEIILELDTFEDGDAYIITIIPSNYPPNMPTIDGITSGKTGMLYNYTCTSVDQENDKLQFYIDWGDDNEWTDFIDSGEYIEISHSWNVKDDYIIRVKARDINGAESDWTTLEVSMSKTKLINDFNPWILRLNQRFPIFGFLI